MLIVCLHRIKIGVNSLLFSLSIKEVRFMSSRISNPANQPYLSTPGTFQTHSSSLNNNNRISSAMEVDIDQRIYSVSAERISSMESCGTKRKKKSYTQEELDDKLFEAVKSDNIDKVKKFIKLGADINATDYGGRNCLHIAAKKGFNEIFAMLLKTGKAKTNVPSDDDKLCGALPIHYAAHYGHADIIKKIVKHDHAATLNEINDCGFSPLHEAIDKGNLDAVKTLLSYKKVDINIPTGADETDSNMVPEGSTPLVMAIILNHPEIVELLIRKPGIDIDLQDTTERSDTAYFEHDGNVLPQNSNVLHLATILKRKEIIIILLKHLNEEAVNEENGNFDDDDESLEFNLDDEVFDEDSNPFRYAVESKDEDIIVAFIQSGKINLNSYVDGENSVLHLACEYGWINVLL